MPTPNAPRPPALVRAAARPAAAPAAALLAALAALAAALVACTPPAPATSDSGAAAGAGAASVAGSTPTLQPQQSGTTALLQAVSPVSDRVVWVSGHRGTWARTLDGGATWQTGHVPGADTLQFRDVYAASADTAFLLSAGPGALSRIFRTVDGGRSWAEQHVNPDSAGFYDCFAFWDASHGLVYGDAVDGRLVVLETTDGATWRRIDDSRLPAAQPDEGGFAASGTCVAARTAGSERHAWIATGNAARPRVLHTADGGRTWAASEPPLPGGEGAGGASVAFRDAEVGVALGGDIGAPQARGDYVAVTTDGGATWRTGGRPTFAGAIYGGAYVPGAERPTLVLVGPGGADWSVDDGRTFARLDTLSYWGVGFASPHAGWLVGPNGRIVKVRVE
ncbi:MAG TPA: hypothetical protein VFS08_19080 [Gemmatimonadaceae bacterium]|nr:hypothetical protein [Gemmatimonadaceae bacterium]